MASHPVLATIEKTFHSNSVTHSFQEKRKHGESNSGKYLRYEFIWINELLEGIPTSGTIKVESLR